MIKWIDVKPNAWYYRDVLELDRIKLSNDPYDKAIIGIPYDTFVSGKPRITKTYIANDNQRVFDLPGYVPSVDNPVYCYIDGIRALVDTTENGKVTLMNPVSKGVEVTFMAAGVPKMQRDYYPCSIRPTETGGAKYPKVDLKRKSNYVFNINYHTNESCVVFNKGLKRVSVIPYTGQDVNALVAESIADHDDQFTIVNGTLYVPYVYNEIPVDVCYNYTDGENIRYVCERVVPSTPTKGKYNDRFFPNTELLRLEFFIILHRLRKNFYNRFTDREFVQNFTNERGITDLQPDLWYAPDTLDVLNEKFIDGCYVFPLYEDGTFRPTDCITRAEAILYINRFIEWTLEKFR